MIISEFGLVKADYWIRQGNALPGRKLDSATSGKRYTSYQNFVYRTRQGQWFGKEVLITSGTKFIR